MIIYAYDTQADGTELGPGSKQRLDAGIKHILESEVWKNWIIILGAGKDLKRPEKPALKTLMKDYIEQKLKEKSFSKWQETDFYWNEGYGRSKRIGLLLAKQDVWGSFDETVSAIDTFLSEYQNKPVFVGYYYAVSADFHLPRIKLIWYMLGRPVKTIGTPWKPTWQEKMLEPVKMLKVILKGIGHQLKGGF